MKLRFILFILLLLFASAIPAQVVRAENETGEQVYPVDYDQNPVMKDIDQMTDSEIQCEMRYALELKESKKFYPESRMNRLISETNRRSMSLLLIEKENTEKKIEQVEAAKTFIADTY